MKFTQKLLRPLASVGGVEREKEKKSEESTTFAYSWKKKKSVLDTHKSHWSNDIREVSGQNILLVKGGLHFCTEKKMPSSFY